MTGGNEKISYVLITSAWNEERFIGNLIESVEAQTIKPARWVIVSDGSTDRTDEIVQSYRERCPYLYFLRTDSDEKPSFSRKVAALNRAIQYATEVDYDFIGNFDADVTFPPDYIESVLGEFARNEKLGVAGGLILELRDGQYLAQSTSDHSVGGAVQMFRKACFAQIGHYLPLERGGEDSAAEITARSKGWRVQTLRDHPVHHHREVLSGSRSPLRAWFNRGIVNYTLGYHPLFHLVVCCKLGTARPLVLSGLAALAGYLYSCGARFERPLSPEAIRFLRKEQLLRLIGRDISQANASRNPSQRKDSAKAG
ncbi:MAG TPA: glycosyltransferase family A protein [Candidatus Sumerlaeota bacterium]|nr:glycosyltransferase family A protein [Candidatus Sumerlaeota bacterium]HPS00376.1 glycosyltransferase family A protein [Candidatus Sumerlaeota bacterium]